MVLTAATIERCQRWDSATTSGASCAAIAAAARATCGSTSTASARSSPGPPPALDPERHYLEGSPEDVAAYLLTLDSINFGSGWFPTLRKRPGCSGYYTVAWALADQFRGNGPWSPDELRRLDAEAVALVLDQDPDHELMGLYAQALNDLGRFLDGRTALEAVEAAGGSAERLATTLAHAMPFFDDTGFWKRAQITANDLALAGVAEFDDIDRLTIFADNLVPHVLRVDGVLVYDEALAAHIDAERAAAAGRRGARDPRLRGARLRADRRRARRAARGRWTSGSGTAARSRATRRCPATAPGRSTTDGDQPPARVRPAAAAQGLDLGAAGLAAGLLGDLVLELVEPVREALDGVGHRVGKVGPVGIGALGLPAVHAHRVAGVADDRGVGRARRGSPPSWPRSWSSCPPRSGRAAWRPEPTTTLSPTVGWRLPRAKPVPPSVTPW